MPKTKDPTAIKKKQHESLVAVVKRDLARAEGAYYSRRRGALSKYLNWQLECALYKMVGWDYRKAQLGKNEERLEYARARLNQALEILNTWAESDCPTLVPGDGK